MRMTALKPKYTAAWGIWAAAFAAIEYAALRDVSGGTTLSEHLRVLLGVHRDAHGLRRAIGGGALIGACVWLVPHLIESGNEHVSA